MPGFDTLAKRLQRPGGGRQRTPDTDAGGLTDGLIDPLQSPQSGAFTGVPVQLKPGKFKDGLNTTAQILGATKRGAVDEIDAGTGSTAVFHGKTQSVFAKTAPDSEANAEVMSTKLMGLMNDNTPDIKKLKADKDSRLGKNNKFAEKMGLMEGQSVIAMPALNAVSMADVLTLDQDKDALYKGDDDYAKELAKHNDKMKLAEEFRGSDDKQEFIQNLGRMAIQDMMIHNTDRLLRANEQGIFEGKSSNSDNIMISSKDVKKASQKLDIKEGPVPIDNMNQLTEANEEQVLDPEKRGELNQQVMSQTEDLDALARTMIKGFNTEWGGNIAARFGMESEDDLEKLFKTGLQSGIDDLISMENVSVEQFGGDETDPMAQGMAAMFNERLALLKEIHGSS